MFATVNPEICATFWGCDVWNQAILHPEMFAEGEMSTQNGRTVHIHGRADIGLAPIYVLMILVPMQKLQK